MKKVLLIAGGGTLGSYVSEELLNKGYEVSVVCLEKKESTRAQLTYLRENATIDNLRKLFNKDHYDGVINFLHYTEVEAYIPYHKLLTENTDHLLFLSSYRVYADSKERITENTPLLLDTITDDPDFLENEKYALSKAKCEKYIQEDFNAKNWTIVRPVISFSDKRFDVVAYNGHRIVEMTQKGETIILPEAARNCGAGLDWAGNTGKIIANLIFKKECMGEIYTVSSGQDITWQAVANIYSELIGAKFKWVSTAEYLKTGVDRFTMMYDRAFDRRIDNTKVLRATDLPQYAFLPIKNAIELELQKIRMLK